MDGTRTLVSFCFVFSDELGDQQPFFITFYADKCTKLRAQQLCFLPQRPCGYQPVKSPVMLPVRIHRAQQVGELCTCHLHRDTLILTHNCCCRIPWCHHSKVHCTPFLTLRELGRDGINHSPQGSWVLRY